MVAITESKPENEAMGSSEPSYPYGTQLDFRDDLADALGFDKLEVGSVVSVSGTAFIQRKSSYDDGEGAENSFCIQLTDVNLKPSKDRAKVLYPDTESNDE